jgi:uncharacterized protein (TIGR03067 family)
MRTSFTLAAVAIAGLLLACGCASTPKRDLGSLQGTWVGEEIGGEKGECRLTIEGDTIRFQGVRQQEWYVGRLTLDPKTQPRQAIILIESCAFPKYANQVARAIYKLEDKKLTIAGHEPGNPAAPTAFAHSTADQTRAFMFTKQ